MFFFLIAILFVLFLLIFISKAHIFFYMKYSIYLSIVRCVLNIVSCLRNFPMKESARLKKNCTEIGTTVNESDQGLIKS